MKLLFISLLLTNAWALTGLEVMRKVDQANHGTIGTSSNMTMTLIDASGSQVTRAMKAKTLEADGGEGDKSIMEFLKPMDVKGTKLLTWVVKDGDNQQWLYLPQFKRVKKINSKNQSGSFMSSEFSFEDIAGEEIEKYDYKLLSEDDKTWKVESIPKRVSGYSKVVTTISKEFMNPLSVEYYDRKGELLKTSKLSGFEKTTVNGKTFHLASEIRMDNAQTKKSSIIKWEKRELGVKHGQNDFKSNKLK